MNVTAHSLDFDDWNSLRTKLCFLIICGGSWKKCVKCENALSLSLSLSLSKCLTFHPLESPFLSWLKLGRLNKFVNKKKWIQLLSSGQDTNTCSVLDICLQSNVTKAKSKKNRPKNLKLCNTGFKCCLGF